MTKEEINSQIGDAAVERKNCLDKISCYETRLKSCLHELKMFLDEEKDPSHPDNQGLINLPSDPRKDAEAYVQELTRSQVLFDFLKKHDAI